MYRIDVYKTRDYQHDEKRQMHQVPDRKQSLIEMQLKHLPDQSVVGQQHLSHVQLLASDLVSLPPLELGCRKQFGIQ